MLFGQKIKYIKTFVLLGSVAFIFACKDDPASKYSSFITPEGGNSIAIGTTIPVKIQYAIGKKIDSIAYFIDSTRVESKKDTASVVLKTDNLHLGNHLLTAKIYTGGEAEDLTANFILLTATAPTQYTYKIVNKYPHDVTSYTEGLEYHDGYFYESAGDYGHSSIRKVDVKTGKVLQKTDLEKQYFGEGMTVIGNKIIQITYKEQAGFVYDKATLKQIAQFSYTAGREGWGLAFDGEKVLNTEGSNSIIYLDKNTYQKTGSLEVYDNKGPVDNLNEIELIDGKIYANVYTTNNIVIINPKSGAVEGVIDLSGLLPNNYFKTEEEIGNNVLNGIAYDKATNRLFVTGKKWPHVFEIKIEKK
jgi:glutamine cyclotransferase